MDCTSFRCALQNLWSYHHDPTSAARFAVLCPTLSYPTRKEDQQTEKYENHGSEPILRNWQSFSYSGSSPWIFICTYKKICKFPILSRLNQTHVCKIWVFKVYFTLILLFACRTSKLPLSLKSSYRYFIIYLYLLSTCSAYHISLILALKNMLWKINYASYNLKGF